MGLEYKGILVEGKTAMVFAEGRMEGIGGKYQNDYAIRHTLDDNGKIVEQKEYLSDLLLAKRLYGQDLYVDKKTME